MNWEKALNDNLKTIIKNWLKEVKKEIPATKKEAVPIIIDTVPYYLLKLGEFLSRRGRAESLLNRSTLSFEHGAQRAELTALNIEQVICETQILKKIVINLMKRRHRLSQRTKSRIDKFFDQAVRDAAKGYMDITNELRERLTILVTHDLMNPLFVIKASLDLILKNMDKREKVEYYIFNVKRNVKRIESMIRNLLDAYALNFNQKLNLNIRKTELGTIFKEIREDMDTLHGGRLKVILDKPVTGVWSKEELKRSVENLLQNAFRYGSPQGTVTLKGWEDFGRVMISVHNWGNTLSKKDQLSLFKKSKKLKVQKGSKSEGWGLGLYLTQELVKAHQGSIFVESSKEKGTTFTIDIPLILSPDQG